MNFFRMTLIHKLTYLNRMKANLLCWEWALPFSPPALPMSAPRAAGWGKCRGTGCQMGDAHELWGLSAW